MSAAADAGARQQEEGVAEGERTEASGGEGEAEGGPRPPGFAGSVGRLSAGEWELAAAAWSAHLVRAPLVRALAESPRLKHVYCGVELTVQVSWRGGDTKCGSRTARGQYTDPSSCGPRLTRCMLIDQRIHLGPTTNCPGPSFP